MKKNNDSQKLIISLLRKNGGGLTITEIVGLTRLSRSTVRVLLARFEGANEISFREIGMAKVYQLECPDEK